MISTNTTNNNINITNTNNNIGTTTTTTTTTTTNPTPTTTTTTNPNLFRAANKNELAQHEQAVNLLKEILEHNLTSSETLPLCHFKPLRTRTQIIRVDALIQKFIVEISSLERQRLLSPKNRLKNIKKSFNSCLNQLLAVVESDSPLQNLLPIDDNLRFMRKRVPVQKERVDFVNAVFGDTVGKGVFILHTKGPSNIGGGRTEFDSAKACLSAMSACIEQSVSWDDVIVHHDKPRTHQYGICKLELGTEPFYAGIRIKFPGTEYWELSDSSRLRHILCSGNPPKKSNVPFDDPMFIRMYPHYSEFLSLVKAQLIQIIKNSHSNPDCDLTIVNCCKTEPVCNGVSFSRKYTDNGSKLVTCVECNLDLCIGGCGRIYHGDTPCYLSLDEASEALIQGSTKRCPYKRCSIPIFKSEGCNHMCCSQCKTEFCYVCGDELPKDKYGHYSTDMHFNPGHYGVGREGGCNQFDH